MRDDGYREPVGAAVQDYYAALDGAMHAVWVHGDWRHLTHQMGDDEREAAAEAVERHHTRLRLDGTLHGLRWWR